MPTNMDKTELLGYLSLCIEKGKDKKDTPVPPEFRDMEGSLEVTEQLIAEGVSPEIILNEALMPGMDRIGRAFSEGKAFVPHLLLSARAMNAALQVLKPYFESGQLKNKGTFIIGTVKGDLHDIGKNLVKSVIEGSGWKVVDLGTDVDAGKFIEALDENPAAAVGMSALITTTMVNMEGMVREIKEKYPDNKILIGGAPVNDEFCKKIGADFFSPDPKQALEFLNEYFLF